MQAKDDEKNVDPFLCRCSKCKKFWMDHFSKNDVKRLKEPPLTRAIKSNCIYSAVKQKEDHPAVLKIGDRVVINDGQLKGVVKYLGPLAENILAPELYVGIHLDKQIGSIHNGMINCKRYFHCPRGHGVIVKYTEVTRLNPPVKKPPINGNYMFPSFKEIQERRRARSLLDPELDLGPLYTAKSSSARNKDKTSGKNNDMAKGGRKASKHEQTSSEIRDYTKDPPRELIMRWTREKFGGGKTGEIKAKTLYKLYAAYQRGEQYIKAELNPDASSSDESSSECGDNRGQLNHTESKLKKNENCE